ncbi:NAD(P)H-binding protein [Pseudoflavitalea sp. X16]|uniref:NAD(P)H-binding protein n=1 Tax=Paraflavitalea devenefica TaxID=2716334 RepID=UPI001421E304|nr:NAD(P)H-binding protein [Paraflavitalea devenefica]NII29411.1 NAD(P)H-binding protein [Paraflavitalea devenefica]
MKALIIGATGATGKDLIKVLLQDPHYTEVVIFVRRQSGMTHPKLSEVLTDFDNLEQVSGSIKGDVWFSCLGTTLKAAGSKGKQWHIDYEIPVKFAEIAKRNGVSRTVLLSAYGASAASNVFYSKLKGQLEDKMASLAFDTYIIFRPGLLLRKDTDRLGERLSAGILKFLNTLGLIRKFRPMPTSTLAEKLAKAPKVLPTGKHVIELDKIFGF